MKITDILNNKKVLIWGYGREGKSTESFIKENCEVAVLDIFEGKEADVKASEYDYVIKSPGIRVDTYCDNFTSQTELFLQEFAGQTIGVTGTKGKSTTSSMLYHVLSKCSGRKTLFVGNIGIPCLDYYKAVDDDTIIVFEMSCHQLSHQHFSPHIAVFLNLYQDHLDYYGTVENYFNAKRNVTANQTADDFFYHGNEVPAIETAAKQTMIAIDDSMSFDMLLKGKHNQFNATFVYTICTENFGCDPEAVKAAICDFHGLPHRLEYAGKIDDVEYYNDSISTIPEATIQAANSIPNVGTILIGGMDRHINYDVLVEFVKAHQEYNYIFSYESGARIYKEVADLACCRYCDDLKAAVDIVREITPKGKACLFSPAAASYGYFKNFEERGDYFKEIIKK